MICDLGTEQRACTALLVLTGAVANLVKTTAGPVFSIPYFGSNVCKAESRRWKMWDGVVVVNHAEPGLAFALLEALLSQYHIQYYSSIKYCIS